MVSARVREKLEAEVILASLWRRSDLDLARVRVADQLPRSTRKRPHCRWSKSWRGQQVGAGLRGPGEHDVAAHPLSVQLNRDGRRSAPRHNLGGEGAAIGAGEPDPGGAGA